MFSLIDVRLDFKEPITIDGGLSLVGIITPMLAEQSGVRVVHTIDGQEQKTGLRLDCVGHGRFEEADIANFPSEVSRKSYKRPLGKFWILWWLKCARPDTKNIIR